MSPVRLLRQFMEGGLVAAALVAARLARIDLGDSRTAVLKLSAVVVGAAAVVTLLSPLLDALPYVPTMLDSAIPLGWLLGLALYFGTQFVLVGVFFDLDESDTRLCVMVMFVVWVATYFGLRVLAMYV
jgi:hypothetical protein